MYKIAIFDFDGTLVDSAPGIIDVMLQVVKEYDLPPEVAERWKTLIGVPLVHQVEIICPERPSHFHEAIVARYREIYDRDPVALCPPFPGLFVMLETLRIKGILSTIASSKRREIVLPVLDHHNLLDFFHLILGHGEVTRHKPDPELVHYTLKHMGVGQHEAVVIGDSRFDLEMAKNAGVDAIGVTTGVHTRSELSEAEPMSIVENLEQALELILRGRRKVA